MRSVWDGPIVLKGIQTVADARLAADAGVEAIALSNHGGRQLDGAPAPLDLVAPVADAVGDRRRDHLRRRGPAGQRHREGRRPGRPSRAWRAAPTSTASAPAASAASTTCSALLDADVRRTMALVGARTVADLCPALVSGPGP